jgi:hypothetical protein
MIEVIETIDPVYLKKTSVLNLPSTSDSQFPLVF